MGINYKVITWNDNYYSYRELCDEGITNAVVSSDSYHHRDHHHWVELRLYNYIERYQMWVFQEKVKIRER